MRNRDEQRSQTTALRRSYEELELLDDDRDDELDDPPPPDELLLDELLDGLLDELLDELLELPVLDDELDDEPLDALLVLDELLEGELEELLELLDDDPSGEVGSVVHPAIPAATTAIGAPDNSRRKSRRRLRSAGSECLRDAVLRGRVGMTILQ